MFHFHTKNIHQTNYGILFDNCNLLITFAPEKCISDVADLS